MARCSVLIPAYNVERYVAQAIESALWQTHPDTEVIVVNDGSTDGTAAAIEPFLDRIVYLDKPNRGPAAARNAALERATGEYIALLDADDLWLPERLQRMLAFLGAHPDFSLATSDAFLLYEDQPSNRTYYRHGPGRKGFPSQNQPYWILQYNFVHAMTVMRRDALDRHGTFDESLPWGVEDWDLWIRCITRGERVGFVAQTLGYYRVRRESLSHDLERVYGDQIAVLELALSRPESSEIEGLVGHMQFLRGAQALAQNDSRAAARLFAAAARDRTLPSRTRMRAAVAAALPGLAWKLHFQRLQTRSPRAPKPDSSSSPRAGER